MTGEERGRAVFDLAAQVAETGSGVVSVDLSSAEIVRVQGIIEAIRNPSATIAREEPTR